MTQMEVAERLDYVDEMNELEVRRKLDSCAKQEKHIRWATSVILVLTIAIVIVSIYQLVEG